MKFNKLSHLTRHALTFPIHVAIYKTLKFGWRMLRIEWRKFLALRRPTFSQPKANSDLRGLFDVARSGLVSVPHSPELQARCDRHLNHEFELLGSGWVKPLPGWQPAGLEGICFSVNEGEGQPVINQVNQANRSHSLKRLELIGVNYASSTAVYEPIDWRVDLRSGFRWPITCFYNELDIGQTKGSDIKSPWELSRLQHLPRMAQVSSQRGDAAMAAEVRHQILDFIAHNPPQYGATWGCPMDVGIRAANMVLAVSLLSDDTKDNEFERYFAASLRDHGRHIVANLEWAPSGRSNHYLSDLAGLVFIGCALEPDEESLTWLAFGLVELAQELELQFHEDGSNFEGSVGYHRLSTELMVYPLALALGLGAQWQSKLKALPEIDLKFARIPAPSGLGPKAAKMLTDLPEVVARRLSGSLAFMQATRLANGQIVQIGDHDSGRFFKFDLFEDAHGLEDELIVDQAIAATQALLGLPNSVECPFSYAITLALSGGNTLNHRILPTRNLMTQTDTTIPIGARLSAEFLAPADALQGLEVFEFPDFGLLIWRNDRVHLTLRAAPHSRDDAPYGHTHDDNLQVTLWVDGQWIWGDPGTYLYTPFPDIRNAYRFADAHNVPRATGLSTLVAGEASLFTILQLAEAHINCAGLSLGHATLCYPGNEASIDRFVQLGSQSIQVWDVAKNCLLAQTMAAENQPPVAKGYGRS